MDLSILYNVFQYTDYTTTIKLIEATKNIDLLFIIGRKLFVEKFFKTIELIEIIRNSGPDQACNFSNTIIYEGEDIEYDDMIKYINIIESINTLKSSDYYACVFMENDYDYEDFIICYNYMVNFKIF